MKKLTEATHVGQDKDYRLWDYQRFYRMISREDLAIRVRG